MATKKKQIETARLEIVCFENEECEVKVNGVAKDLTAAIASVLSNDAEDNKLRSIIHAAIAVVLFMERVEKNQPVKKKAAPKKKK